MSDVQARMKRAQGLKNWQDAEQLIDALIEEAGLTDETTKAAQAAAGKRAAEYMNAKGHSGRKV